MKIIENNYKKEVMKDKYSKIAVCQNCNSKFEYDREDIEYRALGLGGVICPCCNKFTYIDGEEINLTVNNIEFPTHFYHFGLKNNAVKTEDIRKHIKSAIDYFRENKEEYAWCYSTGGLCITVFRYEKDGEYSVRVSKDFYETDIRFKEEDYKEEEDV